MVLYIIRDKKRHKLDCNYYAKELLDRRFCRLLLFFLFFAIRPSILTIDSCSVVKTTLETDNYIENKLDSFLDL